MKLNKNLQTLHNYLKAVMPGVPEDAILLILLSKLALISMMHRVLVDSYHFTRPTIANLYALNFMRSGTGKDRANTEINTLLLPPYFARIECLRDEYRERQGKYIQSIAEALNESESAKQKYINENKPRTLIDTFQDATLEGFVAVREEYQKAGFGGTLTTISEFSDYILSNSSSRDQFLSILKDVYEDGNNEAKVIKMSKTSQSVKGVPSSVLLQSSPDGLFVDGARSKTLAFLNRGIARRSLICFIPESVDYFDDRTFDEFVSETEKIRQESKQMQLIISRMVNINHKAYPVSLLFKCTHEADRTLYEYSKISERDRVEAIEAESKSRMRKAAKLSGLLALIEHPTERTITTEDVDSAISIVDHYGEYLRLFLDSATNDKVTDMYEFLKLNKGIEFTKTEIKKQDFVAANMFARWYEEACNELVELALIDGLQFNRVKNGAIGQIVSLTDWNL